MKVFKLLIICAQRTVILFKFMQFFGRLHSQIKSLKTQIKVIMNIVSNVLFFICFISIFTAQFPVILNKFHVIVLFLKTNYTKYYIYNGFYFCLNGS